MAIATTSQTLFDGNRTTSMQFTGISDGAGQLSLVTLVDPSTLKPKAKAVKVARITGDVSYGIVELYWDALPPVKFAELSGSDIEFDYTKVGPINNTIAGPDATGKVLISTIGFSANSTYMLKLDMTKRYTDPVQVA